MRSIVTAVSQWLRPSAYQPSQERIEYWRDQIARHEKLEYGAWLMLNRYRGDKSPRLGTLAESHEGHCALRMTMDIMEQGVKEYSK